MYSGNYVQLAYDTLGKVAVLNFYKEEITDLDYINYDEHTCTFSFHKGETAKYKISWDYQSETNSIRFIYSQNGMWYRMNNSKMNIFLKRMTEWQYVQWLIGQVMIY